MPDYTYDWGGRNAGPQNPGKYPRVGPAYMQFGEQQGYIYDPYKDIYYPDPKIANQYYQQSGLKPKDSSPSLAGQLGTIGGAALAVEAGKGAGKWGADAVSGYFGSGSNAAAQTGTTAATQAAGQTGTNVASTAGGTFGTTGATTGSSLASTAPTVTNSAAGAFGTAAADAGVSTSAAGMQTISAGAQVPVGYTAVGTAADGGTVIAPAAEAGTTGVLSTAGTALGIAGGIYGAYKLGENLSDNRKDPIGGAAAGAAISVGAMTAYGAMYGSYVGPWGTVIGAAVGAIVGLGLGYIGGNKDKDQLTRDVIRKNLRNQGVLSEDNKITLRDGTQFDVGKDGHFRLPNGDRPYNVDFADKRASQVVGQLNPAVAALLGSGKQKYISDFTGYFTNAVLNSSDPVGNIKGIYDQMGGRDVVYGRVVDMYKNGQLSAADADAYRAAIDNVYNVKNPNQGKGGAAEGFFNLGQTGANVAANDQKKDKNQNAAAPSPEGEKPKPSVRNVGKNEKK